MITRPELVGSFGMVASTHWLASAAGFAALEAGGNAFDAAATAGFVLQVVEPHLNGPGGDVPIIGYDAASGDPFVICGQGPAPAGATTGAFRQLGLEMVPGTGLLAACVPGAFGAWLGLLSTRGRLSLRDVLTPAIGYAETGFPVLPRMRHTMERVAGLFAEEWPTSAAVWLSGGRVPATGSMIRNPALARTLTRLLDEAEAAGPDRSAEIEAARRQFYEGFVAQAIDEFCSSAKVMDSSGERHAGLLRGADLESWRAGVEAPARLDYAGYTVLKAGPWSQGPVMLQQLALLRGFDVGAMGPGSAEFVHLLTEVGKLAFADREAFYGDPAMVEVPLEALLSESYSRARRGEIGDSADVGPLRPGTPEGRTPRLPAVAAAPTTWLDDQLRAGERAPGAGVGEPTIHAGKEMGGDTCHVDVIDRWGNAVSATPSGGWLQSSPVVPGLGFALGTRAQMFWLEEGLANSLAPGKRPRTTLTPTLALRDGRACLAFGTPGGDGQDQWTVQMFVRHVHAGLGLQEAIEQPTFASEHFPSSFYPRDQHPGRLVVEGRFGPDVRADLARRGHEVQVAEPWSLGRVCAVGRDRDGVLRGAADPRDSHCYAVGR